MKVCILLILFICFSSLAQESVSINGREYDFLSVIDKYKYEQLPEEMALKLYAADGIDPLDGNGGFIYGMDYYKEEDLKYFEVKVGEDGKLRSALHGEIKNIKGDGKSSFVMLQDKSGELKIYMVDNPVASFEHHSSFSKGGKVIAAGDIQVKNGVVQMVNSRSGHYDWKILEGRFKGEAVLDRNLFAFLEHLETSGYEYALDDKVVLPRNRLKLTKMMLMNNVNEIDFLKKNRAKPHYRYVSGKQKCINLLKQLLNSSIKSK